MHKQMEILKDVQSWTFMNRRLTMSQVRQIQGLYSPVTMQEHNTTTANNENIYIVPF